MQPLYTCTYTHYTHACTHTHTHLSGRWPRWSSRSSGPVWGNELVTGSLVNEELCGFPSETFSSFDCWLNWLVFGSLGVNWNMFSYLGKSGSSSKLSPSSSSCWPFFFLPDLAAFCRGGTGGICDWGKSLNMSLGAPCLHGDRTDSRIDKTDYLIHNTIHKGLTVWSHCFPGYPTVHHAFPCLWNSS